MSELDVNRAAAALAGGGLAILVDEQGGADLVMAAGRVNTPGIAFMAAHGRGLVELALSPARVEALRLPPMVPHWDSPRKAFTVSVEARRGVSTGISAADRAETIRVAVARETRPDDLVSPGHIFPLRARQVGAEEGFGRAEAALTLAHLCGGGEGAVLCTILDDLGEVAGERYLTELSARYDLTVVHTSSIARFRGRPLAIAAEQVMSWH